MNIEVLLTALIGVFTSLGTWFAARRKNLADVQSGELDNVEKAVKFYREQLEDIANRWKAATDEANTMNSLYRQAIKDLNSMEIRFNQLADENRALIEELKKYKQLNGKIITHE
ncbi:hypothetical protein FNJ88_06330 [Chryseobacterium sp. SNU WT5]|uniref:hypothetical protein n=1 Tax=Chryseobacterium sp. SNU WT5 TaxID=2594269 RepID=UPI00117D6C1F|nr:hypothetical protein [Chryseobacterium sp. SNU WT5]QDP85199.1 hypothetical protein FNJ88_06330 [Chryseobacterium sp. SNU WT5]